MKINKKYGCSFEYKISFGKYGEDKCQIYKLFKYNK